MRKFVSRFFLGICLVFALAAIAGAAPEPVSAASATQTEKILAAGRKMIGNTKYDGKCQKFVRICYEAGGVYSNTYAMTAKQAWKKWKESTSRDNIPIGATVYFTSSSGMGHVGIYTGNGNMLHAMSTVREESISNYGWDKYLGWGYQGGKEPTGSSVESEVDASADSDAESDADMDPNTKPVISSVSRSQTKVKLKWKKVTGADGYRVYRKVKGGRWKRVSTIDCSTTLSCSDRKISQSTSYYYCIRSYEDVDGVTVWSKCSKAVKTKATE